MHSFIQSLLIFLLTPVILRDATQKKEVLWEEAHQLQEEWQSSELLMLQNNDKHDVKKIEQDVPL